MTSECELPMVVHGLVVADFDTELVVLRPAQRRAHHLDGLEALFFNSCQLGHNRHDFVLEVTEATSFALPDVELWIENATAAMTKSGLLEPA